MVNLKVEEPALKYKVAIEPIAKPQPFKWSSISLPEIIATQGRLEASVFGIEGRQARETLKHNKWPVCSLLTDFVQNAFYPGRFKRIYVGKKYGEPFFLPSQINEIQPSPTKYISRSKGIDLSILRVAEDSILMTRSGTIGSCTIVKKTLAGGVFSDDVIRIIAKHVYEVGYLYAFLKSKTGHTLINTNNYGAVVDHIEPEHLANIPIPNPSPILKQQIHDLVMESFRLRDESNCLINEAQTLLNTALNLPEIDAFKPRYFNPNTDFQNFSVNLSKLDGRLEASYHVPIVDKLKKHLVKHAKEITTVSDVRLTAEINLPARFKRIYVREGHGVIFFSGKNIGELDPSDKKHLSFSQHDRRIREQLTLTENMILITCSGTVGNVTLVPKHWDGWAMTHDIIRLVPASLDVTGYLYAWLASSYGNKLITRCAYGAVVSHIEDHHLANVYVPLLHDLAVQKTINNKVLTASTMRYDAYQLEQKALKIMDEQVIFA